ncbi:MAG: hypothetical protein WBF08_09420 [Candidatus Bathyarchaeia archaeon]
MNKDTEKEILQNIERKLDLISKLLAQLIVKDQTTEKDRISLLHDIPINNLDIANLLGKSIQNVNFVISRLKKSK